MLSKLTAIAAHDCAFLSVGFILRQAWSNLVPSWPCQPRGRWSLLSKGSAEVSGLVTVTRKMECIMNLGMRGVITTQAMRNGVGGGPLEETWGHQRSRDSILGRKIHHQTCPAPLLCCLDRWSQQFTVWGLFFPVVRLDELEFISLPSGQGGKNIVSSRVDMIILT